MTVNQPAPTPDQVPQGPEQAPTMVQVADAIRQMNPPDVLNAYNRVVANTNQGTQRATDTLVRNDAMAANFRYQNVGWTLQSSGVNPTPQNIALARQQLLQQWNTNLQTAGLPYRAEDDGRGQLRVTYSGQVATPGPQPGPGPQPAPGPQPGPTPGPSTGPNPAPNTPTNAPSNAPVQIPANLHANVDRPMFQRLDATERNIVTQALGFPAFANNATNQVALVGAFDRMTPANLQTIAQRAEDLARNPGSGEAMDMLQGAMRDLGLNVEQGQALTLIAQRHRDILAAPATGPQQAPPAPFSDTERKGFAAEARRLDGLTGQGSVLQRAMGRLQLAFKGVDLSKLPSVERAEGMAKLVSIIVALVELVGALKKPTEDAAKKRTEELANLSPQELNRKQGIDTLMREGVVEQPPGSGIYVGTGDFGEGAQNIEFRFNAGVWQWRTPGYVWQHEAGASPYPTNTSTNRNRFTPAQNALRIRWNEIGAGLGKRNAAAQTATKEAATKTANEAQEKTNRENVQTELKHLNTLLKSYQTRRSSDGLPALTGDLQSRIEERTKEVTTLISGTSLTEAQRKSLPTAVTDLKGLRQDLAKQFRKNVGQNVVLNPSSYGHGLEGGHIVSHGDGWKVDINGVGNRGAIAFRFDTTSNQWQIKDARSVALWNSFTNVSNYSPTGPFTASGRSQTESIVKKLREVQNEAPIS